VESRWGLKPVRWLKSQQNKNASLQQAGVRSQNLESMFRGLLV
jgi:hypothetical protein